jgi:hypothetical protein
MEERICKRGLLGRHDLVLLIENGSPATAHPAVASLEDSNRC